ncbi:MAG: hypothetical protein Q7J29_04620 [Stagnimonas sp.]|nr:hypothetical protein [Stagnimonas sp.]
MKPSLFKNWFRKTPPATFDVRLPNGLFLQVAFVTAAHASRFTAGYEHLSEQSRRMRFFGQISSLSSKQLVFLTQPDGRNHIAYAALNLANPAEPGVGVARAIRLDADSKIAEVALTILDAYQHQGAGLLLHAAVHVHAAAVGIEQFLYDVSPENPRFIQHLLALGAVRVSQDHDIVRLRLQVTAKPEQIRATTPAAKRFAERLRAVSMAVPARVSAA